MTTRDIFCANDQAITTQVLSVDTINGEIMASCPCGRVLKFPPTVTPATFTELLAAHEEQNKGQVSLAETEALLATLGTTDSNEVAPLADPQPEAPSADQTPA